MSVTPSVSVSEYVIEGQGVLVCVSDEEINDSHLDFPYTTPATSTPEFHSGPVLVVGRLALDRHFVAAVCADAALCVMLTSSTVRELHEMPRPSGREVLEDLVRRGTILVDSIADLESVTARVPKWAARVESVGGSGFLGALHAAARPAVERGSVLVNVSKPWNQPDLLNGPIHFLVDRKEDLESFSGSRAHWMPAEDESRDTRGFVEARRVAWYVLGASQALNAHLIVTDRISLVSALVTSPNIPARTAYLIDTAEIQHLEQDPPRNLSGILRKLQERRGMVLCSHTSDIPRLRALGFGGKVETFDPSVAFSAFRIRQLGQRSVPVVILPEEKTLLIAGHDYKFLGELVSVLGEIPGLTVTYDEWPTQVTHDVSRSDELLLDADVILCEFSSHNAVWYSWHKRSGQRLIVHFHGYELFQDFVHDINVDNVDLFVFVSEFYRQRVVKDLGWPIDRTVVVSNMIDLEDYRGAKIPSARFHLGLAGYVPILKRPDRALDLLELLLKHDDRYVLHLRGRNPWDYSWMWQQPVTQDAYRSFYERLTDDPELLAHLSFDPFGPDMGQWFRRIGWMLSPSSRETFHLAPVEGQASGAVPVIWDRDGAVEIFPGEFVHEDTQAAARAIINGNQDANTYDRHAATARRSVERFDVSSVAPLWADVLFGETQDVPRISEGFERSDLLEKFQRDGRAGDLDRLILLVLLRDQDLMAAEELIEQFPEHTGDLSYLTLDVLREMRTARLFSKGEFIRPPRSPGVAYQPRCGTALFVRESKDQATTLENAVQITADAVTRRARVECPAVLAVSPDAVTSWGVLVAARRLGVPAILVGEQSENESVPPAHEFDAVVTHEDEVTSDVVHAAVAEHARLANHTSSVTLGELTVGLIADEFTERTISGRCRVIRIPRQDAYLAVVEHDLDVLFVESAWSGHKKQWFHGVAYYKDEREDIERVVATARAKGVPVVFWNKEDPVHFRSFAPTAALCDAVYTTDADRIPAYLDLGGEHRPATVASMTFYAEPTLHHPLPGAWVEKPTVSYAGTYYGPRYAERSEELDGILGVAAQHGLTIYDRQLNIPNSPYRFPVRYDEFIEGGLSYDEVLEAYKAHPVHINVNSVNDSPTMFSRRVVEIAASGSVVVSGKGRGVRESLPAVTASDDPDTLGAVMAGCLEDRSMWRASAWDQLRAVRRSYLAEHALAVMFRGAGLPVRLTDETAWTAVVDRLTPEIATNLAEQTHPPAAVTVLSAEDAALATLSAHGIPVTESPVSRWASQWNEIESPTWAEDLMHAARFAPEDVSQIGARTGTSRERGLITWDGATHGPVFSRETESPGRTLIWLLPVQNQKPHEHDHPEETHD